MKNLRNQMIKMLFVVIAVSFLCMVGDTLMSGAFAASSEKKYGGVLRMISKWDAPALGYPPSFSKFLAQIKYALPALESLLTFEKDGSLKPMLAKDWQTDPKAKTITLFLRKGVTFHDGTAFNADVVKWNLEEYKRSGLPNLKSIKTIEVIEPHVVRLNLSEWDNSIPSQLALQPGLMISPKAFKEKGKEWCELNPVGTGPFKFVSWKRDVSIKYKKFEDYWQEGKPYLDGMEWLIFADQTSAEFAFRGGEADLFSAIDITQAESLSKGGKYKYTACPGVFIALAGDSIHVNSPLHDIRIRQAITHAIDTQALVKSTGRGYSIATNQPAPPGSGSFNKDVKGYPYNPEKAKQLLAEAGYKDGLHLKVIWPADSKSAMDQLALAQNYLSKVGITLKVEPQNIGGIMEKMRGGWNNSIFYWNMRASVPDITAEIRSRLSSFGSLFPSIKHPAEVDDLLKEALRTNDMAQKDKLTRQAMKIIIDDYCLISVLSLSQNICFRYPYVHDDGQYDGIVGYVWSPADAWMEKK